MPLEIRRVNKNDRLRQAARNILDIVELGAWGNKFAHELSGGMQQRVGPGAGASPPDPDVLLMDEPFSARSTRSSAASFRTSSCKLSKDPQERPPSSSRTTLDEAVRIGHRIAIMRDGRVVQIGTAEEIVMHPAD